MSVEDRPVAPGGCPAIDDVGAVQPQMDRGNVVSSSNVPLRSRVRGGTLAQCKCGHPLTTHHHINTTGGEGGPCHATVYTQHQMGMTARPCQCLGFDKVKAGSLAPRQGINPDVNGPGANPPTGTGDA